MTDEFGTPVTPVAPPKKSSQTWLIVIIVLIVLCCCCALASGILAWNFGDAVMQWLGVY
jgi:flagellar basal body-associated protein FliL